MQLNTTTPNCFVYKTDELLIELLGGIRIEGLDRLRVTMKVTVTNRKHAGYLNNPELDWGGDFSNWYETQLQPIPCITRLQNFLHTDLRVFQY